MAHTEIEKPIDPATKLKFANPYLADDIPVQQVVADVSVADYNLVKGIRFRAGTLTGVICILWKKLCDECRARGITDMNSVEEFEKLVVTSKLIPKDEYDKLVAEASINIDKQAAEGTLLKQPKAKKKVSE